MQAGPPVAAALYDAVTADKVDGRHAVAASTTPAGRADTQGVYCIVNLDFNPVTVNVSGSLVVSGPTLPYASLGLGSGCEDVPGTQITVRTFLPQPISGSNPATDGSFDLQVWSYN